MYIWGALFTLGHGGQRGSRKDIHEAAVTQSRVGCGDARNPGRLCGQDAYMRCPEGLGVSELGWGWGQVPPLGWTHILQGLRLDPPGGGVSWRVSGPSLLSAWSCPRSEGALTASFSRTLFSWQVHGCPLAGLAVCVSWKGWSHNRAHTPPRIVGEVGGQTGKAVAGPGSQDTMDTNEQLRQDEQEQLQPWWRGGRFWVRGCITLQLGDSKGGVPSEDAQPRACGLPWLLPAGVASRRSHVMPSRLLWTHT